MYIDDTLIVSHDHDHHCRDLSEIFALCHHCGVTLNKEKDVFGMTEIEFLCHVINEDLVSSLKRKIAAVCQNPMPKEMQQLQQFLYMVNFCRCLLLQVGEILTQLLSSNKRSRQTINWMLKAELAFVEIKNKLANATLLTYHV